MKYLLLLMLVGCGEVVTDANEITYHVNTKAIDKATLISIVSAEIQYYDGLKTKDLIVVVWDSLDTIAKECAPTTLTIGQIEGCYNDNVVKVSWDASLKNKRRVEVLAHELAHAWLDDTKDNPDGEHTHSEIFGTDNGQYGGSPEVDSTVELATYDALQVFVSW